MDLAILIPLLIFCVATLYSSVGHGGASGYLAVLSLVVMNPATISTTSLIMNLLVAGIAFVAYARAGHFSWRLTIPFLVGSIPLAFVGGALRISAHVYFMMLGIVLIIAALRMGWRSQGSEEIRPIPLPMALGSGAGIGLVSGIVGVGGGIFLSPVMILTRWATPKQTSATSAFFIVANSLAGLLGRYAKGELVVGTLWPYLVAGLFGALLGSWVGSRKLPNHGLRIVLAVVLLTAGIKMLIKTLS